MKKADIEKLLSAGNFLQALEGLVQSPASVWRDTSELRCLRGLGRGSRALKLANQLYRNEYAQAVREVSSSQEPSAESQLLGDYDLGNQLRYIALVFNEQGDSQRASEILHSLCIRNLSSAALRREYAYTLCNQGKLDGAEEELGKAITLEPSDAQSHAQLAKIYCQTGRIEEGINGFHRAVTLAPNDASLLQQLAFWDSHSGLSNSKSNYWLARLCATKLLASTRFSDAPLPNESPDWRIKIGFLSSSLDSVSAAYFVKPAIQFLDRTEFQVVVYNDSNKEGSELETIKAKCDLWRDILAQTDLEVIETIQRDEIDVLINVDGYAFDKRSRMKVFAFKPVPLQISWLGYPIRTGLPTIDFVISDAILSSSSIVNSVHNEEPLNLKSSFISFDPQENLPDVAYRPRSADVVLGTFVSLTKVSRLSLDAWAAALHAVPSATLYLTCKGLSNESARNHILDEFKQRGISADRLRMKNAIQAAHDRLEKYSEIDIALDSLPYNDLVSTLEALWMGVPVVTILGDTAAGRLSASVLSNLDMSDMIAEDVAHFAERVEALSSSFQNRKELRQNLRIKLQDSVLMQHKEFSNQFGASVRQVWSNRVNRVRADRVSIDNETSVKESKGLSDNG